MLGRVVRPRCASRRFWPAAGSCLPIGRRGRASAVRAWSSRVEARTRIGVDETTAWWPEAGGRCRIRAVFHRSWGAPTRPWLPSGGGAARCAARCGSAGGWRGRCVGRPCAVPVRLRGVRGLRAVRVGAVPLRVRRVRGAAPRRRPRPDGWLRVHAGAARGRPGGHPRPGRPGRIQAWWAVRESRPGGAVRSRWAEGPARHAWVPRAAAPRPTSAWWRAQMPG